MKHIKLDYYNTTALAIILSTLAVAPPANSQPITPANDGTGTTVNQNGNQFDIQGGTRNGANLFHSFDQFNVPTNQTANFLTTPDTSNILGRVTGGNASYINGLLQVIGGNSNLFLMNPAGIMFGPNATLNIPASFSVTTATGIGFDNNNYWFKAMGTNDYSNLVGNPSGYRFNVSTPGAIVNEGNLTLNPGENLTLLGGTVINTGQLSTPGGNITVAAVEGGSTLRISQPGHLLSLEVPSTTGSESETVSITPQSLPELLTGGSDMNATSITVNESGEVVLTASNTAVEDVAGTAIASGNIDVSIPPNPPYEGGDTSSLPLSKGDGRGIGGQVNVLGDRVALVDTTINADGLNGGGTVLIGGDSQESSTVFNSQQTSVNSGSIISANAIENGDGGRVIIWSDGTTNFDGNISAKGGEFSGNGGFVEVTGKQDLTFDGNVNVTTALGDEGTIFSQPESVTIGETENYDSSQTEEDNTEVETTENSEVADGSETTETEALENNTEVETTENSEVAEGSETTEIEAPIDPFAQDDNADVTISAENIGQLSGNVILEADNDITVNEKIETDSSVELKAGRSININADIDTSVGNGNIDLLGNNDEMNIANRSEGAASINQLDGTTLNAGSGTINIELGNLGEVGDINLASLTTTGEVLVNANGGNIARVSSNSLINAGSVLFQTSGSGGIGLTDAPLRLDVENLEAVSGSGGVFFDVGNVNIGDVSEDVDGIVTAGGDIDIKSDGDVSLTESLSTQEIVENNSEAEISPPSQGGDIEATEVTDTNGSINIEATGDIVATGSGIKGGGESVFLSATNIRINDEFDETSGDADVKLSATNDITVEDIEDDVLEFLPGSGEIEFRADVDGDGVGVVEMLDNEADVGSNPDTFENGADTIKTNGRNLTIAGAEIILGNIDTSWLPVYSGGELITIDVDEGGAIPAEGTAGDATFTFTVDGDLGTVENLDVRFSAEHSYNSDLEVYLESPEGQEVTLFAGVGDSGENFQDTVLDDNASTNISDGNAPFNGTYRPQGNLADFNGENPSGTWTLRVTDTADGDSGTLYRSGDGAPWGIATGTQLLLRNPLVGGGRGNGSGGAINLEATHGDIHVGNIRSLSETGDGGIIDLKANNNIITGLINSSAVQGIGGDITIDAGGNIITYGLDSSSSSDSDYGNSGDGGDITISTQTGDINTESLNSSSSSSSSYDSDSDYGNSGIGGDITISTQTGDINTESLNS
ncbi:filamentous hemagglutinin N-terminal domain-containing protein, partial [Dapis sp. BLCC M126]|uniref:two-partner secretion domain-containing protein n=1 Tax=Dapis sp. BLCC M126 TaxID=3400189 RepID=UPI003CF5B9F6